MAMWQQTTTVIAYPSRAGSNPASLTITSDADSLPEGCGIVIPSTRGEYRVYEDQPTSQATSRAASDSNEARLKQPARVVASQFSRVPVLAESLSSVAGPWAIELPVEKYEHEAQESAPDFRLTLRDGTLAARDYFPAVAQIRPLSRYVA